MKRSKGVGEMEFDVCSGWEVLTITMIPMAATTHTHTHKTDHLTPPLFVIAVLTEIVIKIFTYILWILVSTFIYVSLSFFSTSLLYFR